MSGFASSRHRLRIGDTVAHIAKHKPCLAHGWMVPSVPAQALEWMLQLAEAIAYLHSANPMVIHRDLKLENVSGHANEPEVDGQT